jgi:hypothetical protein
VQSLSRLLSDDRYSTQAIFIDEDIRSGESPAVVSQAMANRFWPGVDAIGTRFKDSGGASHLIVGVVADISTALSFTRPPRRLS